MAKLRFQGFLLKEEYTKRNVLRSDDLVIIKHDRSDRERIQKELYSIIAKNDERVARGGEPIELDIVISVKYAHRSVKANNLMWLIYDIQADILNKEAKAVKKITRDELYRNDMNDYAPVNEKVVMKEFASAIIAFAEHDPDCEFRGHLIDKQDVGDDMVRLRFHQTSSFWNTAEMASFIDAKLIELEQMGRDRYGDGDVQQIIRDFNKWKEGNANEKGRSNQE